jgi:hygromycin-B 4-O-kinase
VSIDQSAPRETSAPGVTARQAIAFLIERFGPGVTDLETLRQGGWSNAYAFRHDRQGHVIRFSTYRDDFDKDRFATRWTSPALPVPAMSDIGEAFGGYYAVSTHVPGTPLDDLAAPEFRAAIPALFAMLDALRTANLTGTTGFGGWDGEGVALCTTWQEYLLAVANDDPSLRNHGWRRQLASSPVGIGRFDEAYAHLQELMPHLPAGRHLIHSDLLNHNMLVDGSRISGVIDWGCGLYGDFLYDVAWFQHYWPWYPAWEKIDFVDALRGHYREIGLAVPYLDDRLRCYRIHIGLGDQAYNTYMRRWDLVERAATETLALAHGSMA